MLSLADEKNIYYGIQAFYYTYMLSTLAVFLYHRNVEFIRIRQPLLITLHTLVSLLICQNFLAYFYSFHIFAWNAFGGKHVAAYVVTYAANPFWLLFYFLRCISLVSAYYSNVIQIRKGGVKLNIVEKLMFRILSAISSNSRNNSTKNLLGVDTSNETDHQIVVIGPRTILKASIATLAVGVITLLIVLGYMGCYGHDGWCTNEYAHSTGLDFLPQYIFVAVYFLLIPYFLYLIHNVHESYFLKREFQVTLSTFFICFCVYLVDKFVFYRRMVLIGENVWLFTCVLICHTFSVTLPAIFVTVQTFKQKNPIMDCTLENLHKVLTDGRLFDQFKIILAEDFCIENGLFWNEVSRLESEFHQLQPQQLEKTVLIIFHKYIKPNANFELNITAGTRNMITQEISSKKIKHTIYDQAKKEVFQMMYLNSFPRFLTKSKGINFNTSRQQLKATDAESECV